MLIPLLVLNLGPGPAGSGNLDISVFEIVRDYRLSGAQITIDGTLAGYTSAIGVFRMNGVSSGTHSLEIALDGYNSLTGSFDILPGFTTIAIFRLVPFVNKYLTPYRFPSVVWHSTRYGPKSERTSQ